MAAGEGTMSNDEWIKMWTDEAGIKSPHNKHDRFLDNNKDTLFGGKKSVFLPLCGKCLDILWLYNQGHVVCGVELAEQAIREFIKEHNLEFDIEEIDNVGKVYKSKDKRIQLYVADMFAMTPEICGQFDIIMDSKAFIAINKVDRKKYVDTVLSLMKADGEYYLAAIEYDCATYPGPPHSAPIEIVKENFGERCTVEHLKNDDEPLDDKFTNPPTTDNTRESEESKEMPAFLTSSPTTDDTRESEESKEMPAFLTSSPTTDDTRESEESKEMPAFLTSSTYIIFRWYKMVFKS